MNKWKHFNMRNETVRNLVENESLTETQFVSSLLEAVTTDKAFKSSARVIHDLLLKMGLKAEYFGLQGVALEFDTQSENTAWISLTSGDPNKRDGGHRYYFILQSDLKQDPRIQVAPVKKLLSHDLDRTNRFQEFVPGVAHATFFAGLPSEIALVIAKYCVNRYAKESGKITTEFGA